LRRCLDGTPVCGSRRNSDSSDEPKALARQRPYESLPPTGVANRGASNVQARRESRLGDDTPLPNGIDQVVLADDALPVADEIIEELENLRRDGYSVRSTE